MKTWLTWTAGMLALVGTISSGWLFLDMRYAKAGEVQQQIGDVKNLYLRSELRDLNRQKFQIEVEKQRRKLTPLEQQRLQELDNETRSVERQIKQMDRK